VARETNGCRGRRGEREGRRYIVCMIINVEVDHYPEERVHILGLRAKLLIGLI